MQDIRLNGAVSAHLLRAYRDTRYTAGGVDVRIGRPADAALGGVRSATLISAWNPLSRRMADGWNRRMERALADRLRRFRTCPAEGTLGAWREAHVLVAGDHRAPLRLARVFRQRAVVILRRGAPARLVLLAYGANRPPG
jgi:hypothetical protein